MDRVSRERRIRPIGPRAPAWKKKFNLPAVQIDEDEPSCFVRILYSPLIPLVAGPLQIILDKGESLSSSDNFRLGPTLRETCTSSGRSLLMLLVHVRYAQHEEWPRMNWRGPPRGQNPFWFCLAGGGLSDESDPFSHPCTMIRHHRVWMFAYARCLRDDRWLTKVRGRGLHGTSRYSDDSLNGFGWDWDGIPWMDPLGAAMNWFRREFGCYMLLD